MRMNGIIGIKWIDWMVFERHNNEYHAILVEEMPQLFPDIAFIHTV
jgi:hypothetical protein